MAKQLVFNMADPIEHAAAMQLIKRVKRPRRHRWYIRRIHIHGNGYDDSGNYWGSGTPLWFVHRDDDAFDFHIRGTKEYARNAAAWASCGPATRPDWTARACAHLNATGKIGY